MQHYPALKKQIELIVKANDIEMQRKVLSPLSNQLIETVGIFSLNLETIFVAYCPMAFDDKGANWLSEFEEIRNPYYGNAMLECGEVKKKIRIIGKIELNANQSKGHQH
jgi:Cu(I)/Ag(I) efflux system membrane fusion protein